MTRQARDGGQAARLLAGTGCLAAYFALIALPRVAQAFLFDNLHVFGDNLSESGTPSSWETNYAVGGATTETGHGGFVGRVLDLPDIREQVADFLDDRFGDLTFSAQPSWRGLEIDPDTLTFWDQTHPTAAVHDATGEAALSLLLPVIAVEHRTPPRRRPIRPHSLKPAQV